MQRRFQYFGIAAWVLVLTSGQAAAINYQTIDNNRLPPLRDTAETDSVRPKATSTVESGTSFYLDPKGIARPGSGNDLENKFGYYLSDSVGESRAVPGQIAKHDIDNKFGYAVPGNACPLSPLSSEQIVALIKAAARKYDVEPDFASAVAWAESRFDRIRNSPRGARGPMQLMPDTATELGITDACDPSTNIDGGVRYLRGLLDEFQNPLLAAAAYNAGPKSVRDHGGIPPYSETIKYLAEILNFQLGLRSAGSPKNPNTSNRTTRRPSDSGVIGVVSDGRFVGGVMKF